MEKKQFIALIAAVTVAVLLLVGILVGTLSGSPSDGIENKYQAAIAQLQKGSYDKAAEAFSGLGHYSDATRYAMYAGALSAAEKGNYSDAARTLQALPGFLDSQMLAGYYTGRDCEAQEEFISAQRYYEQLPGFLDCDARAADMPEKQKDKNYRAAAALEEEGKLERALSEFLALGEYSDSAARAAAVQNKISQKAYDAAAALETKGKLEDAREAFLKLGDFSDSAARVVALDNKLLEKKYQAAVALEQEDKVVEAYEAFLALETYGDSADRAAALKNEATYRSAYTKFENRYYSDARADYLSLGDYKDAAEKARLAGACTIADKTYHIDDGLVAIRMNSYWGLVDMVNNRDLKPQYYDIGVLQGSLVWVKDWYGYGLKDMAGDLNIPPQYSNVEMLCDNLIKVKANGLYGIISVTGDLNIEPQYGDVKVLSNDMIAVKVDRLYGIMNKSGEMVVEPSYTAVYDFSDVTGLAVVSWVDAEVGSTVCGLMNKDLTLVTEAAYLDIQIGAKGYYSALVQKGWSNNVYALLSPAGEQLSTWRKLGDSTAPTFSAGIMICQDTEGLYSVMDEDYQVILSGTKGVQRFTRAANAKDYDTLAVTWEDGMQFFDLKCQPLDEHHWANAMLFGDYIKVQNAEGKWGLISLADCTVVAEPAYDKVSEFSEGMCAVKVDSLYGFINAQGELVVEPKYTEVKSFNKGFSQVTTVGGETMWIDATGSMSFFKEDMYLSAIAQEQQQNYEEAIARFELVGDYRDAKDRAVAATAAYDVYAAGIISTSEQLEAEGKLEEALSALTPITNREGVTERQIALTEKIHQRDYDAAAALTAEGKTTQAIRAFRRLGDYSDSAARANQLAADMIYDTGDMASAWTAYAELDEAYRTHEADYAAIFAAAEASEAAGDYAAAFDGYAKLGTYQGADEKKLQAAYSHAADMAAHGDYVNAAATWTDIIDYEDSREQRYLAGVHAGENGKEADALAILSGDIDYPEAREAVYQIAVNAATATDLDAYEVSVAGYTVVEAYKDAPMNLTYDSYTYAGLLREQGCYDEAAAMYQSLNGFADSAELANASLYAAAEKALADHDYVDAVARFSALGSYSDAADRVAQINYQWAQEILDSAEYEAAVASFTDLGTEEGANKAKEARFLLAKSYMTAGDYENAIEHFTVLGEYEDSAELALEARYLLATGLVNNKAYLEAVEHFIVLGEYKDSAEQIPACRYAAAKALYDAEDYAAAETAFQQIAGYEDADALAENCRLKLNWCAYATATDLYDAADYTAAAADFHALIGYEDAEERELDAVYMANDALFNAGKYQEAADGFAAMGDYRDAAARKLASLYALYAADLEAGRYDQAIAGFTSISDYEDAAAKIVEARFAKAADYLEAGEYDLAIQNYEALLADGHENAADLILSCHYAKAVKLNETNHAAAYEEFLLAGTYSDAQQQAADAAYAQAQTYVAAEDRDNAVTWLERAGDNAEAKAQLYTYGSALYTAQDYKQAAFCYKTLRGYQDVNFKMQRIVWYYEKQNDLETAYLVSTYSDEAGQPSEKTLELENRILNENGRALVDQGQTDEAMALYIRMAKLTPVAKTYMNEMNFPAFMAQVAAVKIGDTVWQKLALEDGTYTFIAQSPLSGAAYSEGGDSRTMAERMAEAPGKYFTESEQAFATMWIMSQEELEHYLPTSQSRVVEGTYTYYWTSTVAAETEFDAHVGVDAKTGRIGWTDDSEVGGFRPAMKMTYSMDLYRLLTGDAERITFYDAKGDVLTYERIVEEDGQVLPADYELPRAAEYVEVQVGQYITFGRYPQSSATAAKEPVEWVVLDVKGNKALVVSKVALDAGKYNTTSGSVTWEQCSLRKWLNNEFLNTAFTSAQQAAILTTMVDNSAAQHQSGVADGNNTQDKVFLLSYSEVNRYMPTSTERQCTWTEYCRKGSGWADAGSKICWLLRGPISTGGAPAVSNQGNYRTYTVTSESAAIRPAMWLDLSVIYSLRSQTTSEYTVSAYGTSPYTFELNGNGYYESNNKRKDYTYAMVKITFTSTTGYIYLDCINYAEYQYDFGIISKLDTELDQSYSADGSSRVFRDFRYDHSRGVQTVTIPVADTEEHTIYVKYRKDSGDSKNNDSLQFKVRFE